MRSVERQCASSTFLCYFIFFSIVADAVKYMHATFIFAYAEYVHKMRQRILTPRLTDAQTFAKFFE